MQSGFYDDPYDSSEENVAKLKMPMFQKIFSPLANPFDRIRKNSWSASKEEKEEIKNEINEEIYETIAKDVEVRSRFKDQAEKLAQARAKIAERIKMKRDEFKKRANSSGTRRAFDKLSFFISLIVIQYKSYILGSCPDNEVYTFNFCLMICLFIWRNLTYRVTGDHYYMLEFCYYVNVLLYIFLFLFPQSGVLYYACFAFTTGPLAWALPLVQCKFVLHSVDSLTSVFIHYTPMILMWNLHWRTQYNEDRGWELYNAKLDTFGYDFLNNYFSSAFLMYFTWALGYYLIVFVFAAKRIQTRKYATLMTYYREKDGAENRFFNKFGPKYSGIMYLASHFAVFLLTSTIGILCYFSFIFHCAILIVMSSASFWNGASYYMDYFSKKYEVNLSKLDELKDRIDQDLTESSKRLPQLNRAVISSDGHSRD